jgi:hypothetical protein
MFDDSAAESTPRTVSASGLLGVLRVIGVIIGACAVLIGAAIGAEAWLHLDFDAVVWSEVGVVFLTLTLVRPWWFWSHPKAQLVRGIIGDRATSVLYLAVSAWIIVVGVRRQVTISRTRADCVRALAGVTDVHTRLRILYHAGAVGIPRLSDEPRALSCERLLEARSNRMRAA